ncbi:LuxR C-terminal-related transcriptional regulator [Actinocatenispora comari]|jgi:DNA-binding NarL/FixJ family response regulator|uniref:DNA-binding response regulator n=1 Tax=Actinocatenispora comari TaxID=2807577 RepID=A0A8J4AB58_9ACTN|nr:response regulator transcription factor [Actinocatenispora comari]GIL27495.1 DNA-binding response regulator [Actinocatenispora comari]
MDATVRQIAVCVVEDHPLYRAALVRALSEAPDVTVGVTAGSLEEFSAYRPDPGGVVILDLRLPGVRDAAAVVDVVGRGHRVLVVSAHGDQRDVLAAMAAGARGYLTKNSDADEILRAVREVAAGNSYVSPTLASFLLESSRERQAGVRLELSDREREVLGLVAAGERDQDIAEALNISVRTVRSHLDRIREKTGARRRAELTGEAYRRGIVPPS